MCSRTSVHRLGTREVERLRGRLRDLRVIDRRCIGLAHVALGHGALQPGAEWMKHELARDALRDVLGALLVHGT